MKTHKVKQKKLSSSSQKARTGFEPAIFGLRDRRLTTWPPRLRWSCPPDPFICSCCRCLYRTDMRVRSTNYCPLYTAETWLPPSSINMNYMSDWDSLCKCTVVTRPQGDAVIYRVWTTSLSFADFTSRGLCCSPSPTVSNKEAQRRWQLALCSLC